MLLVYTLLSDDNNASPWKSVKFDPPPIISKCLNW